MTDREGNVNLSKNVFGNQEIKSWSCLGQTCERFLIVFLSQLFYDFADYLACFWRLHLQKLVTNQQFGWNVYVVWLGTFYYQPDSEQGVFYKKSVFLALVDPSETAKSKLSYNLLKI